MASGDPQNPVYGLPFTGTVVTRTDTFPLTQTVLNMNRLTVETIDRIETDDHYTREDHAQAGGDLYHE